ncbi:MAG: sigma-70 family RNA polymerase sigma factor [Kofleriaceae bacterium]
MALIAPATRDPDADLLPALRDGDQRAFEQLVRRHQRGVWRVVHRYVRSEADASDVVQQAFVRALRALPGFRGAASLRSWLYRIAINCALSWLRDHRREVPMEVAELVEERGLTASESSESSAPGRLERLDREGALRAAVTRLPPKQRLVLELRVFDDLSFREVAELADCSENTAKVNFHYALKRLRELMTGAQEAPERATAKVQP